MLNSVLARATHKIQALSSSQIYGSIIKLEWFAIIGLITWLVVIFSAILH
jgi:hypothetical protein